MAARKSRRLDEAHAAYHSSWYIPVVRELAGRSDFRAEPEWIAARLLPPISRGQAKKAIETLLAIGLLREDEGGRVVQAEPLVTTGPERPEPHIARYHRMMMKKASEAIDRVPSAERDISSVQMLVSRRGMPKLKAAIRRFRKELLELAADDDTGKDVVQLNFQIFPVSAEPRRRSKK